VSGRKFKGVKTMKSLKSRKLLVVLVVLLLCGMMFLIYKVLLKPKPSELFLRYVLDPIPASVKNIKADQCGAFRGYEYVFRFDINRADLDLIIKSRPFREAQIINCQDGNLFWVWKGSHDGDAYNGDAYDGGAFSTGLKRRKLSWYTLESWEEPETYALVKEDKVKGVDTRDIQVLFYNAKLGQAFFIVYFSWGT
jgi:hypothetical protein